VPAIFFSSLQNSLGGKRLRTKKINLSIAIGIVAVTFMGCSSKTSEAPVEGAVTSSSTTKTISGTVTGPGGMITRGPLDLLIQPAWASYSAVSGADVRAYKIDEKGRVKDLELGQSVTNVSGNYRLDIPNSESTETPNVVIVATDANDSSKRYISFVEGQNANLGMSSSAIFMAIRSALGMTNATVNELTNTKLHDLSQAAESILTTSNAPDFSSAYNAIINSNSFRTKLNGSTTTDISSTSLVKIAPLALPPIILDGDGHITTSRSFDVGDTITLTAVAVDLFGLPLQYTFKRFRNCILESTLQNWSVDNDLTYTFTEDDITNCTSIIIGVKNNDGTDQDGIFGDVQMSTLFTIRDERLPPTQNSIKVFDSNLIETASRSFHVGDTITLQVNATDPFGLPLEYVFRLYRSCALSSEIQAWSAANTVTYTFTADDITGCTSIVAGVKNNDGIDMDGFFGDLQAATLFTISL